MPLAHVCRDDEEDGGEHGHRHMAGEAGAENEQRQQRQRRGSFRQPASARPIARWWRSARSHRSPATRRTSATRCWRRPAPRARRSDCGDRRSCDRRRPPTSAIRSRRAVATVIAGESSVKMSDGRNSGTWKSGRPDGTAPKRDATVSTGSPASQATAVPTTRPTTVPGMPFTKRLVATTSTSVSTARPSGRGSASCRGGGQSQPDAPTNSPGFSVILRPKKVPNLRAGDEHRDAVREPDDDRTRNEANDRPGARESKDDEHNARHHRAHEEARDAVLGDDARHDHDEGAGRAADLHPRSARARR